MVPNASLAFCRKELELWYQIHLNLKQRELEKWGPCGGKGCVGFGARDTWVLGLALLLISSNSAEIVICPPSWVVGGSVYHELLQGRYAAQG